MEIEKKAQGFEIDWKGWGREMSVLKDYGVELIPTKVTRIIFKRPET